MNDINQKNEKNVKIEYQYDGSKFFGFQRQKDKKTVQGEIERAIKKAFFEEVNMISAGRTDRGVHAMGQVSNFFINKNIPLKAIKTILNKELNGEIKILDIAEVGEKFNARFDAKTRTYLYIMKKREDITPFEKDYVTPIDRDIDPEKLEEIMAVYLGEHNFSNFMKTDRAYKNPIRKIESVKCSYDEKDGRYYVEICGHSFLKSMVRIMMGSALEVYFDRKERGYIKERLKNHDIPAKKILAAGSGLYLYKIKY